MDNIVIMTDSQLTALADRVAAAAFSKAQTDGTLDKVQSKCLEIASVNPPGSLHPDSGDLEALFDAAFDVVSTN